MIPAFGFSIGDFIAVGHLVQEVYKCVAATPGLQRELNAIRTHYAGLLTSVRTIWNVYEQNPIPIAAETQNCLEFHLERSKKHLERFLAETRVVTSNNAGSQKSIFFSKIIQRATFAPHLKSSVDHLVKDFGREREAFHLCVEALTA